jgi:hypothetical protein
LKNFGCSDNKAMSQVWQHYPNVTKLEWGAKLSGYYFFLFLLLKSLHTTERVIATNVKECGYMPHSFAGSASILPYLTKHPGTFPPPSYSPSHFSLSSKHFILRASNKNSKTFTTKTDAHS